MSQKEWNDVKAFWNFSKSSTEKLTLVIKGKIEEEQVLD